MKPSFFFLCSLVFTLYHDHHEGIYGTEMGELDKGLDIKRDGEENEVGFFRILQLSSTPLAVLSCLGGCCFLHLDAYEWNWR